MHQCLLSEQIQLFQQIFPVCITQSASDWMKISGMCFTACLQVSLIQWTKRYCFLTAVICSLWDVGVLCRQSGGFVLVWYSSSISDDPPASWSFSVHITCKSSPYFWRQIVPVHKVRQQLAMCVCVCVLDAGMKSKSLQSLPWFRYCWGSLTPSDSLQVEGVQASRKAFLGKKEKCLFSYVLRLTN